MSEKTMQYYEYFIYPLYEKIHIPIARRSDSLVDYDARFCRRYASKPKRLYHETTGVLYYATRVLQ